MDKATPRPWFINENGPNYHGIQYSVVKSAQASSNQQVYVFRSDDKELSANAELIVKAVNLHDEMIRFVENFVAGYISDSALMPEAKRLLAKVKEVM